MKHEIPRTPFSMRLSRSAKETELRLRSIFQWKKKRPPTALFLLTAVLVLACCGLVSCRTQTEHPPADDPAASPTPGAAQGTGQYASMEDFAAAAMAEQTTATYYVLTDGSADGGTAAANVTGTRIKELTRHGELSGLSPDGTLEAWHFHYEIQIDADPSTVAMPGGVYERDGWFDLEGQGGHYIVALRYPDGSYDVLYDEPVNDGMDFYGYHHSWEEAIHDWYVTEYGLELPLYVTDLLPADELGSYPAHRFDGDGWYLYVPVSAWSVPALNEAGEYECHSEYNTGSGFRIYKIKLSVDELKTQFLLDGREISPITAGSAIQAQGRATEHSGVDTDVAYIFEAAADCCYVMHIFWNDIGITDYPYIAIEPTVLQAMADSFTILGRPAVPLHKEELTGLTLDENGQGDDTITLLTYETDWDDPGGHPTAIVRLGSGEELSCELASESSSFPVLQAAYLTDPARQSVLVCLESTTSNYGYARYHVLEVKDGAPVTFDLGSIPSEYGESHETLYEFEILPPQDNGLSVARIGTLSSKWHAPNWGTLAWTGSGWDFTLDGYFTDTETLTVDGGLELTLAMRGRWDSENERLYYDQLQILHGGTVLQTITENSFTPDDHCWFEFFNADYPLADVDLADVNFDGSQDFGVPCNRTHNEGHCWFLYDPQTRLYRYAFSLSGKLTLKEQEGQLTEEWHNDNGDETVYNVYEYDETGKLTLIRSGAQPYA